MYVCHVVRETTLANLVVWIYHWLSFLISPWVDFKLGLMFVKIITFAPHWGHMFYIHIGKT